jgi:putative ABC transport system substrate-binding protein
MIASRRRRDLLTGAAALLGAALAAPSGALSQPRGRPFRIAYLQAMSFVHTEPWEGAFFGELKRLGWEEGRNIAVERRSANGDSGALMALAGELIAREPDLIFAPGGGEAYFARRASDRVPIVFACVDDPVDLGLVQSLARPGGNATGLSSGANLVAGKWFELLREIAPKVASIGYTVETRHPGAPSQLVRTQKVAAPFSIALRSIPIREITDYAVEVLKHAYRGAGDIDALIVPAAPLAMNGSRGVLEYLNKTGVPVVFGAERLVEQGGLACYASDYAHLYRRAAGYVDRLLRGMRPEALPVEQPAQYRLALNLRTAKEMGIAMPRSVLLRADRVIE